MKRRIAIAASLLCVAASIAVTVLILRTGPSFDYKPEPVTREIIQPRAQSPVFMYPVGPTTPTTPRFSATTPGTTP